MSAEESSLPGFKPYDFPKTKRGAKSGKKIHWESVGAVKVPIYQEVDRFRIVYRPSKKAKRIKVSSKTLPEARKAAQKICEDIARGRISAGRLTADELIQAATALELVRPHGWTLDGLAREATAAVKSAGGASLAEMARFWAQHHQAALSKATAAHVHAELIDAKRDHVEVGKYWHQLQKDLGRFAKAFGTQPIGEITSKQILEYLRELGVGWVRRNNVHGMIVTLFRYAKAEKYLPQDRVTEPELVPKLPKPRDTPPADIFTVAQMEAILRTMENGEERDKAWIPFVVLGAFAGLRIAEAEKLRWDDVLWEDGLIKVRAEVAKRTARKHGDARFIQMPANLLTWLSTWKGTEGNVAPEGRFDNYRRRIANLLPEKRWGKNPLRHSWLSYSEAQVGDLSHVVGQAGNSVAIAKTHYLNPRMKREGRAWFSILPSLKRGRIVVPMHPGA